MTHVDDILALLNGGVGGLNRIPALTSDAEAAQFGRQNENQGVVANVLAEFREALGGLVDDTKYLIRVDPDADAVYWLNSLGQSRLDGYAIAHQAQVFLQLTFKTATALSNKIEVLNDLDLPRPTVVLDDIATDAETKGQSRLYYGKFLYAVTLPALADMNMANLAQAGNYALVHLVGESGFGPRYVNDRGEVLESQVAVTTFAMDGSDTLREQVADRLIGRIPSGHKRQLSYAAGTPVELDEPSTIKIDRMVFTTRILNTGD